MGHSECACQADFLGSGHHVLIVGQVLGECVGLLKDDVVVVVFQQTDVAAVLFDRVTLEPGGRVGDLPVVGEDYLVLDGPAVVVVLEERELCDCYRIELISLASPFLSKAKMVT